MTIRSNRRIRAKAPATLTCAALILVGCASMDKATDKAPAVPSALEMARTETGASQARTFAATESAPSPRPFTESMPGLPAAPPAKSVAPVERDGITPATDAVSTGLNFAQVPIGEFVRTVYGQILKRTVVVEDKVQASRDLITIRTPTDLPPVEIERLTRNLLADYGILVEEKDGAVRVSADPSAATALPEIRRGAAKAEMPADLRHVFHLVPLQAVRNTDVAGWLKTMFGDRVDVREDAGRNSLILSGQPDAVAAALQAIRVLDQPVMEGRSSVRINPRHWSAKEFASDLSQILAAEGYSMPPANYSPQSSGVRYPVILIPVEQINSVLVFATTDQVLKHVQDWAYRLDVPNKATGSKAELVQYMVQNTTAEHLGGVLKELLETSPAQTRPKAQSAQEADEVSTGKAQVDDLSSLTLMSVGGVVVDTGTNSLSFRATPDERDAILALLRSLDKPARSVLLDVTIAEVRLDKKNELGVDWLFKEASITSEVGSSATIGGSGFKLSWLASPDDLRVVVNALATSNKATILSTPTIMARSGEQAEIQVGQDVPIITSQQSSLAASSGDSTGVLQTVQYRTTGVILKVKPIIHSVDLVDVEVEQEVSAAQRTLTGVDSSPTISTRRMKTNLNLRHGSTVLLGGLISNEQTNSETGVPGLKDVPVLGALFRKSVNSQDRKELVMLITPYILSETAEFDAVLQSFNQRMSLWEEKIGR